MSETVAVAMSGGVDSAVAASLLCEQGYSVFGLTARMTVEYSRCCADEDIQRAAEMAGDMGIEHHVVELSDQFQRSVIDYFVNEYISGRTPSPCVCCNSAIKFGALLEHATALGASKMATGHYARILQGAGNSGLARGVDKSKDQSYFLARLTGRQLDCTLFPLGSMLKSDVEQYAADHHLAARESRESQDICFVTEGSHGDYIDLRSFKTGGPGAIVDGTGRRLGTHRGIHFYTVGQRKGLGIATGRPMYVVDIDAEKNLVRVGERSEAMRQEMIVADPTWIDGSPSPSAFKALCQVRYNHRASPCRVLLMDNGSLSVVFDRPQFAITPGQLAAFYQDDRVLGGGWIQ